MTAARWDQRVAMDEELIAFLSERFDDAQRRLEASFDQRFADVQHRLEVSFDRRFDDAQRRLEASFDQRFEDAKRHFGVIAESLRNDVRLIAEGHRGLERELREFRRENDAAHREIIGAIGLSHAGLDRRVTRLESRADRIEERVERLEPRAE